jgi:pimeloyl-ACP methyl ester carboxylesterase
VVDEDFESRFAQSQSKALLFWGKEDTATPLYTGELIASLIPSSQFYPLDGDHFFFLKHADFIEEKVLKAL